MDTNNRDNGRGLWDIHSGHLHRGEDGDEITTTIRARDDGTSKDKKDRGTRLIWGSVLLLAALAGVAFYVSYAAQFRFVYAIKHLADAAAAEALIPDAGMLICAMLALAMAVQGRSAKTARVVVVAFAALSAVMNYEAANSYSAHSVTVYVMPAIAFAVCTDLVVSVVRRFYYGIEEGSPWAAVGRALAAAARVLGLILLYALRFMLDRRETWRGLRQMVLNAAPLPATEVPEKPAGDRCWCSNPLPCLVHGTVVPELPPTKKAALLNLYRAHADYGDRAKASKVAAELGPRVGLQPGSARTYIYAELAADAS
jgi:Protein of unknown function (DUF2637)